MPTGQEENCFTATGYVSGLARAEEAQRATVDLSRGLFFSIG